jgi:hypothetical protein
MFEGVPAAERRAITNENCARLYGIEVGESAAAS